MKALTTLLLILLSSVCFSNTLVWHPQNGSDDALDPNNWTPSIPIHSQSLVINKDLNQPCTLDSPNDVWVNSITLESMSPAETSLFNVNSRLFVI